MQDLDVVEVGRNTHRWQTTDIVRPAELGQKVAAECRTTVVALAPPTDSAHPPWRNGGEWAIATGRLPANRAGRQQADFLSSRVADVRT
jgi:hypothetical protein